MEHEPQEEAGHRGGHRDALTRDLADVLVDVTALQGRLNHLAGDLALTMPADRQQVCRRLLAILGDGLDLLDDYASGRIR